MSNYRLAQKGKQYRVFDLLTTTWKTSWGEREEILAFFMQKTQEEGVETLMKLALGFPHGMLDLDARPILDEERAALLIQFQEQLEEFAAEEDAAAFLHAQARVLCQQYSASQQEFEKQKGEVLEALSAIGTYTNLLFAALGGENPEKARALLTKLNSWRRAAEYEMKQMNGVLLC